MPSFQQTALALAVTGSIVLLGGCGDNGIKAKRHAQEECFYRMMLMSAAGVSYLLEHKLSETNTIAAGALAIYLKSGADGIVCPKTRLKYEDFNLEGPKCPEHGKVFDVYSSALADKNHPCRARALSLIGYAKDPWNDQHSTALIAGLISVARNEQGKIKTDSIATLRRITGQGFGEDTEAWFSWWQTNGTTFRFKQPN
jgi:hypothetical protein